MITGKERLSRCRTLFLTFLKIGAFTFGGGYAMIPLIQRETVETHGWVTEEDVLNIIAVAESTPGPIAINSATFVGYKVAGFWGSLCATLGVVLPSFIVISILSFFLEPFKQLKLVSLSPQEAGGIRGVAVKCIDITKNSDCEGSALGRH